MNKIAPIISSILTGIFFGLMFTLSVASFVKGYVGLGIICTLLSLGFLIFLIHDFIRYKNGK